MRTRANTSIAWVLVMLMGLVAHARSSAFASDRSVFSPPPPPLETPPWWELELGASAIAPLMRSTICPGVSEFGRASSCVLNAGVGVGARWTYRMPDGLGWLVGYDLWVLDSANVYEVALTHALRVGVRWVVDSSSRVQPWVGATLGGLLFGEPLAVFTAGGLVTAGAGLHAELSENFAVFASGEARLISLAPFRTADGARRADPVGVGLVVDVTIGALARFGALVEHERPRSSASH